MPIVNPDRYYRRAELAAMFSVTPGTIDVWRRQGLLQAIKPTGHRNGAILFTGESVAALVGQVAS